MSGFRRHVPHSNGRAEFYNPNPRPRAQSGTSLRFDPVSERLPFFSPPVEAWPTSPVHDKYPLAFFQEHTRWRVHTQYAEVPSAPRVGPRPDGEDEPDGRGQSIDRDR